MAFEEVKLIDLIEITENGTVQVRQATRVMKDGERVAETYHRWSFPKGSDISSMPANVQSIAAAAWA